MKILALGDLHGKLPKNFKSILNKNKVELVIAIGELPDVTFKPKRNESEKQRSLRFSKHYEKLLKKIDSLKIPVFSLRGNEGGKEGDKLFKIYKNIKHKKTGKIKFEGKTFIMFDFIWEGDIKKASKFVKNKMKSNEYREKRLNELLKENKDAVLVSHAPPSGKLDIVCNERTNFKKKHVGSEILLKVIKKHQPKLVLCGHIHEGKGKAKIGKTIIYNLGSHGSYKILEV